MSTSLEYRLYPDAALLPVSDDDLWSEPTKDAVVIAKTAGSGKTFVIKSIPSIQFQARSGDRLPIVKLTATSLKKVLGCATGQKWQARAAERFNPNGRLENWPQGGAGATAAALKVAGGTT